MSTQHNDGGPASQRGGRPLITGERMVTCSFQLPVSLWAEIGKQAEIVSVSRAEVGRRLIALGLAAQKREIEAIPAAE